MITLFLQVILPDRNKTLQLEYPLDLKRKNQLPLLPASVTWVYTASPELEPECIGGDTISSIAPEILSPISLPADEVTKHFLLY